MIRKALASVALLTAVASTGRAQQPSAKPATVPDSMVKKLVGVWEGSYASDHAGPGGLRVEIGRDSVWTLAMDIIGDQTMSSRGSNVRLDGNKLVWAQQLMGMTCESTGTLTTAGKIDGGIDCGGGGVTFSLKRKE